MSAYPFEQSEVTDFHEFDAEATLYPQFYTRPPPPPPPPPLPDFVHSTFGSYTNTPSTASPNSQFFPQHSSTYGSSAGPSKASTITPVSSDNSIAPKDNLKPDYEMLRTVMSDGDASNEPDFILEMPMVPKPKADKSKRSCMLCYREKRKCDGAHPHRCHHCVGRTYYCKGPIKNPDLVNFDGLHGSAAAMLAACARSHDLFFLGHNLGAFETALTLRPLAGSSKASDQQIYELRIPGIGDDFLFRWEGEQCNNVLDALVAAEPAQMSDSDRLYDLGLYKRLCRRFCHCMSILRSLDRCKMNLTNVHHLKAVHTVVGFICDLSRTASLTLTKVFDEIRRCCSVKRERNSTQVLMFMITDHLGEICKEIDALQDTLQLGYYPSLFNDFFFDVDATLRNIENLARGLRVEDFNFANRSAPLQFGGLHITFPIAQGAGSGSDPKLRQREVAFMDVLQGFKDVNHNRTVNSAHPILPYGDRMGNPEDNTGDDGQTTNVAVPFYHNEDTSGNGFQRLTSGSDIAMDGLDAVMVSNWEAEAYASFRPELTSAFDTCTIAPDLAVSEAQSQTSIDKLIPAFSSCGSPQDQRSITNPDSTYSMNSHTKSYRSASFLAGTKSTSAVGESIESTCFPRYTKTVPTQVRTLSSSNVQAAQKPSKRRKLSSLIAQKKQSTATSKHSKTNKVGYQEGFSGVQAPVLITSPPVSGQPASCNTRGSLAPAGDHHSHALKSDGTANRGQDTSTERRLDNVGAVKGVNITRSEQRPLSWPRRNHFRRSPDISVKALTKNFATQSRIEDGNGTCS